ncbi:MAG: NifU family protein [Chitinophagales bacterium]
MSDFNKYSQLWQEVDRALESMRPYLKKDGGNIEIVEITADKVVRLKLLGACETCPQSFMTMRAGIQEAVKKAVPEIQSIVAINLTKPTTNFQS